MARRILWALAGFSLALLVFAGLAFDRAARVGTGPVATGPRPAGPTRDIAFVSNAVGGTVSLVALDTLAVLGEIDVIPDGAKVGFFRDPLQALIGQRVLERSGLNYAQDSDVSPDGTVLYVSRGHLGDVAAFDIATGALMWRRPVAGFRADHMALSIDGARLFVAGLTAETVDVIDTATGGRVGSFVTGIFPHDNHVSKDGERIYNASLGDMTVDVAERDTVEEATERKGFAYQITIADTRNFEVLHRHRFSYGIRPFAVTAIEDRLYAQISNAHAVIEYDIGKQEIVRRADLPIADGVTEDDWDFEAPHHGLTLTPDESTLCLAGRASDYAALVSTETLEPTAIIPVGDAPSWSATSPDGRLCILANNRSDDISVVSYAERREIARLKGGRAPKHITTARVPVSVLTAYAGQAE